MDRAKEAPKLEYRTPHLERYGTLSELTRAGRTTSGDDFIIYKDETSGSVITPHPPGDKGPGS